MRKVGIINIISILIDGVAIFTSYLLATYLRFNLMYDSNLSLEIVWSRDYLLAAIIYAIVIILFFYLNNIYFVGYYREITNKLTKIIYVNTFTVILLFAILYFTKIIDFSRLAIVYFYLISSTILVVKYLLMRKLSGSYYQQEEHLRHVVIVGNGALAQEYIKTANDKKYCIDIEGYISRPKKQIDTKWLGLYEDIPAILDNPDVDEVVVALEHHEYIFMPLIMESCEKSGVKISIIPSYNKFIPSHPKIEILDNIKLLNLREIPLDDLGNSFIKRVLDLSVCIIAIIITLPVMFFAYIGIKISMPGPVIFTQERLGRNKKIFKMYKFRSMKINSQSDVAWSTDDDSRRTTFGKFIRKFSIDELPQLFNVLKGDMSLVGPRPEIPHYTVKFKEEVPLYLVRNQVKPGMTGWAQVNGLRGDTSIEKRVKYDIYYIENWNIGFDIKILTMTLFGGFINKEKL